MSNGQSATENRLERDLAVWDRIEARQVQRYGQGILKDRGFLAAKREMYKYIMQKYMGKRPNIYERAEMKVLQSQRREFLRRMFPNPFIRALRNFLALNVNLIRLAGRMTLGAIRGATGVLTGQQKKPTTAKQGAAARQNTPEFRKQISPNSPAVVRKLPAKPRIVPKPAKSKGIRR
ncbi:MAG: hypothetical protein E6Q24_14975 [Chitinophagaceae bacterium]|nr:MAG: hypothetical protein E6Q24_14975 [Chitinophagaceae bacterium]